jgi:hypothetical protein
MVSPLLLEMKPNWYVIGRFASVHTEAKNSKSVVNSTPDNGSTLKVPGSGGPFVVTTTDVLDGPQDKEKVKVALTGRDPVPSTKFMLLVLPLGMTFDVGDKALASRATDGSSTDHSATHEDCTVTDPLSVNCWFVLTSVALLALEVILTRGADESTVSTTIDAVLDRVASNTVTLMRDVVLIARLLATTSHVSKLFVEKSRGHDVLNIGDV